MNLDPFTPVLVGVAQILQRPEDPAQAVEPLALMEQALRQALADSGGAPLDTQLDYVGVVRGAWKYSDPGRLLAERLGVNAKSGMSPNGGNTPQAYVNAISARIAAGEISAGAIVGAETIWSRRRQRRAGVHVPTTEQVDVSPDEHFGEDVPMTNTFEHSRGVEAPIHFYPIFESAIRAARGETLDQHRDRVAELWSRFNQVAVNNPYAWSRQAMTADEIRNPSETNRMVGFPYTKAMNSNWDLDQAAALVLCSAQVAEAAGIPRDKWVFPWAGTEAHDTYAVSNRNNLHSSPAIEACGQELFSLTGLSPDTINHIDIYSCFPSAVQVSATALGISHDRQLTQTGGLTFAGGPLNNYVTHSIATMADRLRQDPGARGLVTANGGFLTKHALGIYSTEPSPTPFSVSNVQNEVDQVPSTPLDEAYAGAVEIEAYTVMHNREGPEAGFCAVRTPDGARSWGKVNDPTTLGTMIVEEAIGQGAQLAADGALTL